MLITKFNRLIRNKFLWAIFALLVCFSFVFGSLFGRGGRDDRKAGTAGTLFGEEVSNRAFFQARFFELGMRERPGLSPEANELLREKTWKRLAALDKAGKMGLTVTPAEIADVIQRDPTFQANGVFNKARYRGIIEQQLRVSVPMFEEYVRQDILMRKLMQVIQSMVWIAPEEVARRLENLTDGFQLEYAVITPDEVVDDVQVSMEDAREFYDKNPEMFTEPEQVNVRYVAFPITNDLYAVTVSDEDLATYYDDHQQEFMVSSTNGEESLLPFDDAKNTIMEILTRRKATFRTRDDATDLVMALTPGRYSQGSSLEKAAQQRGRVVVTTEYFSAQGNVPGIDDVGSEFASTAFALDAGSADAYFSDPIVGSNYVYVIAAHNRRAARIPEFDDVADRALKAAEAEAKQEALFAKANQIRSAAVAATNTFAAALEPYNIPLSTTKVFTVYDGNEDMEYSDALLPEIMELEEGEYTPCIPVPEGVILARISERTPGDIASAQLLRPQLVATLGRYRAAMLYEDWSDALLVQAEFKDYAVVPASDKESG